MFYLIFLGVLLRPTQSACSFNNVPQIVQTGKAQIISNGNLTSFTPIQSFTSVFSTIFVSQPDTSAISLISFTQPMSMDMVFNLSIVTLNLTHTTISSQIYNNTYFFSLGVHYLFAVGGGFWSSVSGCFFCSNLLLGSGPRSQNFSLLSTPIVQNGSFVLTSVIQGLKMRNILTPYLNVQVSAFVPIASATITVTISTDYETIVQFVCLSFLLTSNYYQGSSATITLNQNTDVYNQFNPSYPFIFINPNQMFFGYSSLTFPIDTTPTRSILFESQNYLNVSSGFSTSAVSQAILQQLLFTAISGLSPTDLFYNNSCAAGCPTGTYADINFFCQACNSICSGCSMNPNNCTSCDATLSRNLTLNQCLCNTNYYDNNTALCLACNITNCLQCSSATACTQCSNPFIVNNTQCVCPAGLYLLQNSCSNLIGCLSTRTITSGTYCEECDATRGFTNNSIQKCDCMPNTLFSGTECKGVCQDSLTLLGEQCDDGNAVSGDGCSPLCTVELGWHCSTKVPGAISICVQQTVYSANYLFAQKSITNNQVSLYFQITPANSVLGKMNFTSFVTLTFPHSTLTTSYNPTTGILKVMTQYLTTIQSYTYNATIAFNPFIIYAPNINVSFLATGSNYQLIYDDHSQIDSIGPTIGLLAGLVGLIVAFFAGVLDQQLLGISYVLPLQSTYFGLICAQATPSSLAFINGLGYSTGYNEFVPFDSFNSQGMPRGLITLQFQPDFILNYNAMGVLLVISAAIMLIIVKAVQHYQQSKQEKQSSKLNRFYLFFLNKCFLFIVAINALRIIVAFTAQFLHSSNTQNSLAFELNLGVSYILQFVLMLSLVYLGNEYTKDLVLKCRSPKYPYVLIVQYMVVNMVNVSVMNESYRLYVGLCGSLIPLVSEIVFRAHGSVANAIIAFASPLIYVMAMLFYFLLSSIDLVSYSTYICLVIPALFLAVGVVIVIRVIYIRKCSQTHDKENPLEADQQAAHEAIREGLMYESIKGRIIYNSIKEADVSWDKKDSLIDQKIQKDNQIVPLENKQKQENGGIEDINDEDNQLALLKKKLKNQFYQKKIGVKKIILENIKEEKLLD